MKRFLVYLTCFVGLLAAFYGGLWGYYTCQMRRLSFALPPHKTILAIGDSQVQAALDDTLLVSVANIADSHDHYWSQLRRLQLYCAANPQVTTVLVGVSPHTVARFKDEYLRNYGYIDKVTRLYMPWLTASDWAYLLGQDATDVMASLCTPLSHYLHPSADHIREMGHFEAVDYSHLETDLAEGATRLCEDSAVVARYGNRETLRALRALVDWCRSQNLRLIGLDTPVLDAAHYFNMQNYETLMQGEFADIERWEYLDLPLPDSCRRDVNHLNRWGAERFSRLLAERLGERVPPADSLACPTSNP